jgi:hypothetical protein
VWLLGEKKGGQLQTIVAELGRQLALLFERQFAEYFVAQGETHDSISNQLVI